MSCDLNLLDLAQRLVIVATGVKVGQHPVGGEVDVHEKVGACGRQELGCHLLTLDRDSRMQRVAGRHPHRQTKQLAHAMVLQVRDQHLEVVQVRLRSDETRDVVHHERVIPPGKPVAQRFGRGHVNTVVLAVGDFGPLAGLEVHEVLGDVAQRALFRHCISGLIEELHRDVEFLNESSIRARQALKHDFHRRPPFQTGELRLEVR